MTEIITSFAMGASVPEWLIAVEPMSPGSKRGNFRFAVDVDVVETPDVFLVAIRSLASGYTILDMGGVQGCRLFAASKPVRIINATIDFLPEGMTPFVPINQAPPVREAMPVVDPGPPSYWRRLWSALFGPFA